MKKWHLCSPKLWEGIELSGDNFRFRSVSPEANVRAKTCGSNSSRLGERSDAFNTAEQLYKCVSKTGNIFVT